MVLILTAFFLRFFYLYFAKKKKIGLKFRQTACKQLIHTNRVSLFTHTYFVVGAGGPYIPR